MVEAASLIRSSGRPHLCNQRWPLLLLQSSSGKGSRGSRHAACSAEPRLPLCATGGAGPRRRHEGRRGGLCGGVVALRLLVFASSSSMTIGLHLMAAPGASLGRRSGLHGGQEAQATCRFCTWECSSNCLPSGEPR